MEKGLVCLLICAMISLSWCTTTDDPYFKFDYELPPKQAYLVNYTEKYKSPDPHFRPDYKPPPKTGHIFAAIAHMEPLVKLERRLVEKARDYLNAERLKLNGMKQFADAVEKSMTLSKEDPKVYLENPVNSYLIIKRFTSGWKEMLGRLSIDDSKVKEIKDLMEEHADFLPTYEDDLLGSISALIRLMDTYAITARQISDGNIPGAGKSIYAMTASDLIQITELTHNAKRYNRMMEFFLETERIMIDDKLRATRGGNLTMKSYHEYGAWCQYLNGDMKQALHHVEEILKIDPTSDQGLRNLPIYKWYVDRDLPCKHPECMYVAQSRDLQDTLVDYTRYNMACRGLLRTPLRRIKRSSRLVCFYKNDQPRLVLKPVRVTRVHDNPEALVFHGIVSKKLSEKIIRIATPELRPAQVIDQETQEIKSAPYRVAKNMWIRPFMGEPGASEVAHKIDQISQDVTNLQTKYSEENMVQNYGIGGQYEFHVDHGDPGSFLDSHEHGNRIATLLFYLTDVQSGGHTVFTKLGIASHAKAGDALFWFSMYKNGTVNPFTEHAGCPVISGSKWIVNKWFKMKSGEQSRLCSLNRLE